MRLTHAQHPGRAVRLAYCLNLHAARTLEELLASLQGVTVPLRERLAPGRPFGVGMYVPGRLAVELASPDGARGREQLRAFLREHGLEACTWNAFPYGDFQTDGLKERVFEPTWLEPERAEFTLAVASLATQLADDGAGHLSISTHTGMHGAACGPAERDGCALALSRAAIELARLEAESGRRCVLSLEAEPRASCNDTAELERFLARMRSLCEDAAEADTLLRHLGACLDACHAAVEFELLPAAVANATASGAPLGKLQWTSALALLRPTDATARARLLALDEPRFLHQVTGRRGDGTLVRAGDLPELAPAHTEWGSEPTWRDCEELRCHFHVPIDREGLDGGLATTQAFADDLVRSALLDPAAWGTDELHLEIETYTWDVLPPELRPTTPAALTDALEREYHHALAVLTDAGWHPA